MKKEIELESKIESLHDIEKLVDELSANYEISGELYGNVLISALEAANNAIVHGNRLDSNKKVRVTVFDEEGKLHLIFKDQGKGFDYTSIPDPTAPENIENISGRGVFLMEKLSDQMCFYDQGSKVELIFNIKE